MKKVIFLSFLLVSLLCSNLHASEVNYQLIVVSNGVSYNYLLSDLPEITFEDEEMKVTTNEETFTTFERSDVSDIKFDIVENKETAISKEYVSTTKEIGFTYIDGETIVLENIERDFQISLYDLTGKKLQANIQRTDNDAKVYVGGLPKGCYILKVGNKSYKILKK